MLNPSLLEESLAVLGESLAERGLAFEIVAVPEAAVCFCLV